MKIPPAPALAVLALCVGLAPVALAAPVITEFMASNDTALYDEDGQSSDWIEVHNPDASPIDLGGYCLTNDAGELTMWQFPVLTLAPGASVIVFASNKDRDVGELHTNFRLSKDAGGYVALVDPDGQTVVSEYVDYPEQFDDFSYGLAQTGSTTTDILVRENDSCTLLVPDFRHRYLVARPRVQRRRVDAGQHRRRLRAQLWLRQPHRRGRRCGGADPTTPTRRSTCASRSRSTASTTSPGSLSA